MNDHEIRQQAELARMEVDRQIARERDAAMLGERDHDDDFEPPALPIHHQPPEPEARGSELTREQRLAAIERGLGKPAPEAIRHAVLGPPPAPPEPEQPPVEPTSYDLEDIEWAAAIDSRINDDTH